VQHVSAGLVVVLPPCPSSARVARELVGNTLRDWRAEELCEDAALVITELVVNAIKHAQTDLELRMVHIDGGVRIEVRDGSTSLPTRRDATDVAENGRGLRLVDALAARYGVEPEQTGKRVWVELQSA
jgi:anti-sigma regulatory factor (Ser/Thr protein kinase)